MQNWEYAEQVWDELDNFGFQLTLYLNDAEEATGARKYTFGGKQGTFSAMDVETPMRKQLAEIGKNGWEVVQITFKIQVILDGILNDLSLGN